MSSYQGGEILDIMSAYAVNRNSYIEKLIRKYLISKLPVYSNVLEFGAGKGEFILRFINEKIKISAVEIDKSYAEKLSAYVRVFSSIDDVPESIDAIYLIDVLEHIEEESPLLKKVFSKLNRGGKIFIYVPARKELYSQFDKSIGHFRRYSRSELYNIVAKEGFKITLCRYHELLGYFASGLNKLTSNQPGLNPRSVMLYDRILVPVTNFLEKIISPPIGKSIYLVAEKP